MTYYEILEVDTSCGYEQIKKSYRRLVKIYHPDVNPTMDAKHKILRITEAYEVLSDPSKRASYDWQLSLSTASDIKFQYEPEPQVDEREQQRREYVKWKRKRDQEAWEHQFHLKATFYKYQRYFAFVFLVVGLLFTADHFIIHAEGPHRMSEVKLDRWGNTGGRIAGINYKTSPKFFHELRGKGVRRGYLHYSGIFHLPAAISAEGSGVYGLNRTLHAFHNIFAYLVIVISTAMIRFKKYSDAMLTIGLLPVFIILFLIVFVTSVPYSV